MTLQQILHFLEQTLNVMHAIIEKPLFSNLQLQEQRKLWRCTLYVLIVEIDGKNNDVVTLYFLTVLYRVHVLVNRFLVFVAMLGTVIKSHAFQPYLAIQNFL
jgi:hypothetical protein